MNVWQAVDRIRSGNMVAYPTETFYGLAVNAHDRDALNRLNELKGRPADKAFPLLVADLEVLQRYVDEIPRVVIRLAEAFWPGPLTIILTARGLPDKLKGPSGGYGFRISRHPVAGELARLLGQALTTTSANLAGKPPAQTAAEVTAAFGQAELTVLDGGPTPGGSPSTVVDLTEPTRPRLVREGAEPWTDILAAVGGMNG